MRMVLKVFLRDNSLSENVSIGIGIGVPRTQRSAIVVLVDWVEMSRSPSEQSPTDVVIAA